jgi:manganese transport protein
MSQLQHDISLSEVHNSVDTKPQASRIKQFFAFFGPAYLVSVGYMDPGNWATDLEGGSRFGHQLIWILIMSNLMAIVLQSLCARLGVVYKRDLAQANRDTYPAIINIPLYLLAEIAIIACDLAEVLGMAIGLKLLTGIPLLWGVVITALDTLLLLYLQKLGIRKMEAFIISLVGIIFLCFAIQLVFVQPSFKSIALGAIPSALNNEALYIAIGIIGATVMPHNLYLHSALVQTRKIGNTDADIKRSIKFYTIDSTIALNLALFVNAAILILAATVFYNNNLHEVNSIEQAHQLLAPLVGTALAPTLFAIALIAAGQSSTITSTLAGQIIMEGYLKIRINPWLRRFITRALAILPAAATIYIFGETQVTNLLVLSQVVLSVQLPFAIIPLIIFVSDKNKMKNFAIKKPLLFIACIIASIILYLNTKLIFTKGLEFANSSSSIYLKLIIIIGLLLFVLLILATIIFPFINRQHISKSIHGAMLNLSPMPLPANNTIAIALDFSDMDNKIINHALQQGGHKATYILIHVVESAGAKILGANSNDSETKTDNEQLQQYVEYLATLGYNAIPKIGYRNRINEIARITKEAKANLLVLGAHGHSGILDYLYGETVNAVRHKVDVPVLVVK